ncbi:MAG: protein kinase [Desulfobacterium sp.]|nr:protein kinase [Desulfobacterium sp.]MBU3949461.1 protein kinase [Pseudomonadota bacterium]MBU4038005.1 protein kinase [Pseudomonadota bacterium]
MENTKTDILLISISKELVDFVAGVLENEGYCVHKASSMRDALTAIDLSPVGLILCGIELEDISGEQFLSYLKKDPKRESIPFIFLLSTESQKELSPKRAIEIGAENFIFFPTEGPVVVSCIKDFLKPPLKAQPADSSSINKDSKDSQANITRSGLTESGQVQNNERRTEKRERFDVPIPVEISRDCKTWINGFILNRSKSSAMIETSLRRRYGEDIFIREPKDETGTTVAGSVVHVLLGDESKQIGFGVVFRKNNGVPWQSFSEHMMDKTRRQAILPIRRDFFPIAAEVSRDGVFWIDAQITGCDVMSASLKTSILAKPKDIMIVKFERHGIKNIVNGKIKKVELDQKELLAIIELDFAEDEGWLKLYTHFAVIAGPELSDKEKKDKIQQKPQYKVIKAESAEDLNIKKNDAVALIQKSAPRKPESKNKRFYLSLIGRKMDNYEVVSFISAGGMGGVFKGWDTALERDVALKVISWELSSQEEFVKMFLKEARFVSKLNHPNIAQIYYIGNANGIMYYAMEFIHGQTLADLLKSNTHFKVPQIINYLKTLCSALEFVWKNDIIHRDIKPANIMVTNSDELKLVDFGVAKLDKKSDVQEENKIVGSPLYLSPEAIRNQGVDNRSDIYSLGATFYHLLAGTPPFYDDSCSNILIKQLNEPVPSLKKKAPELPDILCDTIEKMMAKRCEERFQNYQEIIDCLNNCSFS